MNKIIFTLFIFLLHFQFFAQDELDELDDEYIEKPAEEIRKVWKNHPNPTTFKGELFYEPYDKNHVAILGDGKILYLEMISEDIEIVTEWLDYYVVFNDSTRKLTVKGRTGNVMSSMLVPENYDVVGLLKDGMTDHERYYTTYAFELDNFEIEEVKRYNKLCKLISVR